VNNVAMTEDNGCSESGPKAQREKHIFLFFLIYLRILQKQNKTQTKTKTTTKT
jgi:hypothetical protein